VGPSVEGLNRQKRTSPIIYVKEVHIVKKKGGISGKIEVCLNGEKIRYCGGGCVEIHLEAATRIGTARNHLCGTWTSAASTSATSPR
jgi:hypothetical protein